MKNKDKRIAVSGLAGVFLLLNNIMLSNLIVSDSTLAFTSFVKGAGFMNTQLKDTPNGTL